MIVSLLDFYFNHQERWEFHITLRVKFRLNILIRSGDTTSNTRRPEHRRAAGCRQHVYTLPLLEEKWRRRGRRGSERRRLRKNKEGKIREREGREDEKLMERKGKWRKCEEEGMGWWDKLGKGRMRKVEGWERKRKRGGTEKKRKKRRKSEKSPKRAILPNFQVWRLLYETSLPNLGQIWHASANQRHTLPCQISSWSAYPVIPDIITRTWPILKRFGGSSIHTAKPIRPKFGVLE